MSPEQLLKTADVARLEGMSTRWLAKQIQAGKFPKPDFPAEKRGAPDRWLSSTVQKAREDRLSARQNSARLS